MKSIKIGLKKKGNEKIIHFYVFTKNYNNQNGNINLFKYPFQK